ncbi:MAG TPA: hypothetical protein VET87_00670 [Rubrivivax sp.]|nr:hypothetical protein [Rubrivivax sp.]
MKKTLSSLTVAALALFGAQSVMAQAASAPTRAEVKKEAADANKAASKSLVPADAAGQQSPKEKAATTDTTRDARKAATAEANKAGAIPGTGTGKSGDAAGVVSPKAAAATSDTTRDARKASTAAANKAGEIPGTGVSNVPAESGAAPKKSP